jgi:hypothetical protein
MPQHTSVKLYLRKVLYRTTHWETWHWLVKYMPMVPAWIWLCIKARSPWFFTAANPTLTFGGYEGEPKREMYARLPDGTYPRTIFISPAMPLSRVEDLIHKENLSYPLAVKPDVGRMGFLFRKINSLQQLREYHENMKADYLLQEFISFPLEVSIFYYRMPGEQKGTITGFVKKECLQVTGDGTSTLLELILKYPRAWFRMKEMKVRHGAKLNTIIPSGQHYILCDALNLSRGGKLVNLEHEKDEELLKVFDHISNNGNFYFGRYDVKCESVADLKKGQNFSILEFNGSGAEPHHVYGNGYSLLQAINILLHHWNILYQISIANHKNGIPFWTFTRGLRHLMQARTHFTMLRKLESDSATSFNKTTDEGQNDAQVSQQILPVA